MSTYRKLPAQQRRFVDMIVRGSTQTDAMAKLRPHLKRPAELACRWRALPEIEAAIEERSDEAMRDAGISNAQVLLDIARIARASMHSLVHRTGEKQGKFKTVDELDEETARVVQSVRLADGTIEYRLPSRLEALKLLGQYRKLFTQNVALNGHLTLEQLVGQSMEPEGGEGGEGAA